MGVASQEAQLLEFLPCKPEVKDCDVESCQGSESSTGAPRTESAQSEHSRDVLEANGVGEMDVSQLMCYTTDAHTMSTVQPMLCLMQREPNGVVKITPCMGNMAYAEGEHRALYCQVEQQQDGSSRITPCTNAEYCGVTKDAGGSELRASNQKSCAESSAPPWIYGTEWPYCVAPTTLMLSELPDDLTQEDFIEILDKEDFSGFYDFVTLPSRAESGSERNFRYALVNCTRHEHALSLSGKMHGKTTWGASVSSHGCQVSWSQPMQGVSELIEHYRSDPSNSEDTPEEKRPAYFSEGWPAPFPQPSCGIEPAWW
jgi:hypothetical protein